MKKLLVHMKGYTKECIISPLFKLLEACFELLVPFLVANIVDIGIANHDKPYVVRMCIIMAIFGFVGLTCSLIAQYFAAKAAVGFSTKVKHSLFAHIQTLSYSEIDTLGTSTLITRMTSDMNQIQNGVNLTLRLFMRSPFIVFGAMAMAFIVDKNAAYVFAVTIPILSLVVFGIMLSTIPLYKKVQGKLDRVLGITRENLQGVRVIRAFGQEKEEEEKFKSATKELNVAQKFVGKISALMNPMTYAILNIAISVLIWKGAIRVNMGDLTQGEVIALYNLMSQILVELIKLANLIISITKAVACGNRVQSVFEIKSSLKGADTVPEEVETPYSVEFNDATLKYVTSNEPSLENIDFKIKKGQTVGIIGGTGSGKTSLVNLISRFYDVTDGEVKVNGINVKDYPLDTLREKIGVVPQKAVLFRGSIKDNMKWGNKNASDEDILKAIEQAQATDVLASKPDGLDSYIEQGGKNLSGGQRQRFTIARALVKKPEILILDDSASALDFATDAALRSSISKIDHSPTVFIVSQRTASIMHSDVIIVLDDGKIAGIGKHEELLEGCIVYSEIYNSQFRKENV
ncbi:MAG: ABC transporter ATP-binding protein [Clostridia bacterium]|nr:ABC transporter ATP-binding protein [Clostridia bacterium]